MKFVIEKLGFEEFKRRWEEAYVSMGHARPDREPIRLLQHQDEPVPLIMPTRPEATGVTGVVQGNGATGNGQTAQAPLNQESAYQMWKRTNVVAQKQPGYAAVVIKLPMGDITAAQMYVVADLAEAYSNGNLRTTINQNLIIRWVPESRVEALYEELIKHGLADPGAELVEDIIACPGTDTCGLGITSSKGLARALAEVFPPGKVPEDLNDVSVKISGCHNSCAQHHIATIGLHGVGKRMYDHVAPHYELHLGGRIDGVPKIGQMTIKLPAKNVPSAISHLIEVWRRDRQDGESLREYIDRMGKPKLKDELIPYSFQPTFEEDPSYYFDWEGEDEFILEDLGPGECAGGAPEMIENRLLEAEQELYQAKLLENKDQHAPALNKMYHAVLAAAKAVLVLEGVDPNTDAETFIEFERRFGDSGKIPSVYAKPTTSIGDLGPKETTAAFAQSKMEYAKGFVDACRALTDSMEHELKMKEAAQKTDEKKDDGPAPGPVGKTPTTLDLRGVMCPINYVKTKLKLEMMDEGELLEVWLDAGDPIRNVPQSLRNDGQKVLSETPSENFFKVTVEKVA